MLNLLTYWICLYLLILDNAVWKQLGPLHPDAASILYDLAGLYIAQGKYDQGSWLRKQALVAYVLPYLKLKQKGWIMALTNLEHVLVSKKATGDQNSLSFWH